MTTRPGYIWSGTEWIAIGQEAIVNPFYYQATAPSTPSTGDIWIESDVDVPSVDSAQFLRWRKTVTGGQTSLSGTDDNSLPLQYTPGYEQVFLNGVLLVRGDDYIATTGTTITGLTALTASDVVEVFSTLARTVADVYTQTQSDAKYGVIGTSAPFRISAGQEVATFSASASSTGSITFPVGRFTQAPVLTGNIITSASASIGAIIRFSSITSSGANYTMTITTSNTASIGFNWTAIQMTSSAYTTGTAQ